MDTHTVGAFRGETGAGASNEDDDRERSRDVKDSGNLTDPPRRKLEVKPIMTDVDQEAVKALSCIEILALRDDDANIVQLSGIPDFRMPFYLIVETGTSSHM